MQVPNYFRTELDHTDESSLYDRRRRLVLFCEYMLITNLKSTSIKSLTLGDHVIKYGVMKIFSQIETSPDEIGKIAKAVSDRIDGDKDAICLLLYFCNVFIQGWYDEIIDKLNPLHVKEAAASNRKLTAIELTPLAEFIERSYYKHLASVENSLKKVLDLFANGELINILDEKKITDIRRIQDHLVYFGTVAADQKNEWYQSSIKNRSLDLDARVIDDWENELATISRRVSKLELRLEDGLGCQQKQMSELFRQYREQRRRRWYSLWRK